MRDHSGHRDVCTPGMRAVPALHRDLGSARSYPGSDYVNTFGRNFRCTTFGESHGTALGVVVDGCPPGIELEETDIQAYLDRRRPGKSPLESPRNEADRVEILSGVFLGKTTGAPIALLVCNRDVRSA